MNIYTYVENNPLINEDPTGHWSWKKALKAVATVAKVAYNVTIGDDIRTLTSSNASFGAKLFAGVSLASNFIPGGGAIAKVGAKLVANEVAHVVEKKVASKVATLAANKIQGQAAEALAKKELQSEGYKILGSQVSVKTAEGRRIVDHLVQDAKGNIKAIEVKSGNAVLSKSQLAKDTSMASKGGTIIGKNAPVELKGVTKKITTEVRRY
ncbi:hypothetical protein [Cohnella yongneupensis]|uniref:Pre-toxin TG domain-containing protein n=1 Tax=Cohnella yongneupensis TaxID=425006 RepID=A0ABW0R0F9_9BACL